MRHDLVIRSRKVHLPTGARPATVAVDAGRITNIVAYEAAIDGADTVDLKGLALLPGLVDTHVHINEPGRTHWEGFETASRAAAAGGVTTLIDMPLNSIPPTVDVKALALKRSAAAAQAHVDIGFWGGAVPHNTDQLRALHEAGVFGFKAFLADSGVPEFPAVTPDELELAAKYVPEALFVVHAEDPSLLDTSPSSSRFTDFVNSRPQEAETAAVASVIGIARRTGTRMHILHLSAGAALPMLAMARREGVRVTAETCPHYLTLTESDVPDGATEYKCCPPLRGAENLDVLWEALRDGTISTIVTDHSPCPPELKRGDFAQAWGGIASVQLSLPLIWTEAARRGFTLDDVVRWQCANTAQLVGLTRKGAIAVGADADLVAFDPDARFTVDPAQLWHRHQVSPYCGRELRGTVMGVWLRGRRITARPSGQLLRTE